MKHRLQKRQTRRLQRKQRAMQAWGQERLEGMARFVLRTTLTFSMLYLTATEILRGKVGLETIIFWHAVGLIFGLYKWMSNETKYQAALSKAPLKGAPYAVVLEKRPFRQNSP